MNRVEQLINDFEQYIDECKPSTFNKNKLTVDRATIDDFLAEFRMCMPEVIERSEKIMMNKDEIIRDAQSQADQMITEANSKKEDLIDEHEIVQQAIARGNEMLKAAKDQSEQILNDATLQAQEIVDQAVTESNAYKENAFNFVLNGMRSLREQYESHLESSKSLFENHLAKMSGDFNQISAIYDQLASSMPAEEAPKGEE